MRIVLYLSGTGITIVAFALIYFSLEILSQKTEQP